MGELVSVHGEDSFYGAWEHSAFIPAPLADCEPMLTGSTYRLVAQAGRELAALDATARQLPNPYLLRMPALRLEAQATSALEGTYAPLSDVMTAGDDIQDTPEMTEVLNYVQMADYGFDAVRSGRRISIGLLEELQGCLMRNTPIEQESGRIRHTQVVIGRRDDADPLMPAIKTARFVPVPPGDQLRAGIECLVDWIGKDHSADIDPVVAAAMIHYQFEALHPFRDGNGRLGRHLIVLTLMLHGLLSEPTLTVSPWFEARCSEYYDALLGVSTRGDWNTYISFFARGLVEAAVTTRRRMLELVGVQAELKSKVAQSNLRSLHAQELIDIAIANPTFTIRKVVEETGLTHGGAARLMGRLVDLGILTVIGVSGQQNRYAAPEALKILLRGQN
ncbi:Fic family protein [Arcanobacterium haemolyticum]|nr:Fic family protein [Arcanobacterium haemolyticum]